VEAVLVPMRDFTVSVLKNKSGRDMVPYPPDRGRDAAGRIGESLEATVLTHIDQVSNQDMSSSIRDGAEGSSQVDEPRRTWLRPGPIG
jgi:hypothetical protein